MTTGETVQDLIYEWLFAHYPDGPRWIDPDFDAYRNVPIEIGMISAFDAIESNMSNGGWAQVLWNCYGCWREMISIAKQGYALIEATDQVLALDELQRICELNAGDCAAAMSVEDGTTRNFGEFTARSYGVTGLDWQARFYDQSGIYEKRLAWLANNEHAVRRAVGFKAS